MSEHQETDLWWGAYAGRTLAPTHVFCALLSVNIALISGWLWDEEHLNPHVVWHLAVFLIVAVWFFPLTFCVYRTLSYNYRLTTRCLYCDRGFRRPATGKAELAHITGVRVEYTTLERLVGVGRLVVEIHGERPLILIGVYNPEPVAQLIRRWSEKARTPREAARVR